MAPFAPILRSYRLTGLQSRGPVALAAMRLDNLAARKAEAGFLIGVARPDPAKPTSFCSSIWLWRLAREHTTSDLKHCCETGDARLRPTPDAVSSLLENAMSHLLQQALSSHDQTSAQVFIPFSPPLNDNRHHHHGPVATRRGARAWPAGWRAEVDEEFVKEDKGEGKIDDRAGEELRKTDEEKLDLSSAKVSHESW